MTGRIVDRVFLGAITLLALLLIISGVITVIGIASTAPLFALSITALIALIYPVGYFVEKKIIEIERKEESE